MIERIPPQNLEAEYAVLGAMLIEKEAIAKVTEFLRAGDFYREANRLIFDAMMELYNKGEAIDMVTVTEHLRKQDKLERVGGIAYITSLANAVPTAANVVHHGKIVEEKSILRHLINSATQIAGMGYEDSEDVEDILDKAEKSIMEVSGRKISGDFTSIKDVVYKAFDKIEHLFQSKGAITGLPSGFKDLDKLTAGLQPSDLILIAARPSMGKTAFTLNIATNVALRSKKPVAFFSLEMSKEQLVQRILCSEAAIDSQKLRVGELDDHDWEKLITVSDALSQAPLFIDDTPGITVLEMRSKARRLKMEQGLSLIVIDYLQLMQGSG